MTEKVASSPADGSTLPEQSEAPASQQQDAAAASAPDAAVEPQQVAAPVPPPNTPESPEPGKETDSAPAEDQASAPAEKAGLAEEAGPAEEAAPADEAAPVEEAGPVKEAAPANEAETAEEAATAEAVSSAPTQGSGSEPEEGMGPAASEGMGSAPDEGMGPAASEGMGSAPDGEQEPAAPEPKRGGGKKVLGIVGAVVVLLAGLAAVAVTVGRDALPLLQEKDPTADAKVGDCIAKLPDVGTGEEKTAPDARVVTCSAADAAYTVIGRVNDQTEEQAKTSKDCEKYVKPGESYFVYSKVEPGGTGYLLCLKPAA